MFDRLYTTDTKITQTAHNVISYCLGVSSKVWSVMLYIWSEHPEEIWWVILASYPVYTNFESHKRQVPESPNTWTKINAQYEQCMKQHLYLELNHLLFVPIHICQQNQGHYTPIKHTGYVSFSRFPRQCTPNIPSVY